MCKLVPCVEILFAGESRLETRIRLVYARGSSKPEKHLRRGKGRILGVLGFGCSGRRFLRPNALHQWSINQFPGFRR